MTQRFTDKKVLTRLVGIPGWIIYRDSMNGMYARNEELSIDLNLMYWNITLNHPKLDRVIDDVRYQIRKAILEN